MRSDGAAATPRDPADRGALGDATATRRRLTLLAASLGFAVVQLDVSVVNVAIHAIGVALGGNVTALQWIVSAYTLTFAAFILTAGTLGDRIGARRVYAGGFLLFTLASAACGAAPSVGALIAARAVQGIGAAVLVPCSLSLVSHSYQQPRERARAIGLWALGASAALSGGPLVGGVLINLLGWRAIFFINVPLGVLALWLVAAFVGETSRAPSRGIDVPGQLAAIIALGALAGSTIEAGARGFVDPLVLGGYGVALLAGAAFVALETHGASPLLPLSLFRAREFGMPATIGLLLNISIYGLIFLFSLFFQRIQGDSALQAGLAFAPMTVAVMVANVAARRLGSADRPSRLVMLGAVGLALSCGGLLVAGRGSSYASLAAQLVLLGFSVGVVVPAITAAELGSVERGRSGLAAATLNTMRQTGSVIGVALFGSLVAGSRDFVGGLHVALAISVALALCIAGLAARMQTPAPSS